MFQVLWVFYFFVPDRCHDTDAFTHRHARCKEAPRACSITYNQEDHVLAHGQKYTLHVCAKVCKT